MGMLHLSEDLLCLWCWTTNTKTQKLHSKWIKKRMLCKEDLQTRTHTYCPYSHPTWRKTLVLNTHRICSPFVLSTGLSSPRALFGLFTPVLHSISLSLPSGAPQRLHLCPCPGNLVNISTHAAPHTQQKHIIERRCIRRLCRCNMHEGCQGTREVDGVWHVTLWHHHYRRNRRSSGPRTKTS